jgi:penicillin-binding protein 1B
MQLARSLWLDREKNWRRKIEETLIALHLEAALSKEKIFEHYANQIYLGQRGTFSLHGFGQGSWAFFGKDVRDLTLAEAATLAGLIQRPTYYDPSRFPERAKERRNVVLQLMRDNEAITEAQYQQAVNEPIVLSQRSLDVLETQYFLDMVIADPRTRLSEWEGGTHTRRIYTTLDADLQRAAMEAVRIGMRKVDKLVSKRGGELPQVALVAIDTRTGDIKALLGGRNYAASQLNRALARRQPGSVFKPFVYAAALNTAYNGGPQVFTPASTVDDSPTTFWFNNKPYEPNNFDGGFYGRVTFRRALARSLNNATVRVAEMVGYNAVADLARRAGLGDNVQATPSVALGSYEATPIDVAGAYTIFANQGMYVRPNIISSIRSRDGALLYSYTPERRPVLKPQVAYLMENMLEEVMRSGTAAGVRSQGFNDPAAGKTGTSRDGWFAGFTSELLCVVWVGYDDNRDLKLEGSKSALPIWTEFMKRAHANHRARPIAAPNGIVRAQIDPSSGQLATAWCPSSYAEVFVQGTEPHQYCSLNHLESPDSTFVLSTTGSAPAPVRNEQLQQ